MTYSHEHLAAHARRVEALITAEPESGIVYLNREDARIAALALSLFAHVSPLIVEALVYEDTAAGIA